MQHKGYIYDGKIRMWDNTSIGILINPTAIVELSVMEVFELLEFMEEKKITYEKEKREFYESI